MRLHSTALIVALTFTLFACKQKKQTEQTIVNDTIPVKLLSIQMETVQEHIEASGQFTTEDETYLSFKTGGVVQHVYVKEGDRVKKGQLLASLNMTEIQAQVQQAKILLEKAQRDNKRAENLYRDSVATLEQVQNSKTALDIAQQQFTAARFNENYSEIHAVKDGYVLKKFVNDGQITGPGNPVFQINSTNSNWVLKATVSERDWQTIKTGDNATILSEASNGDPVQATVKSKSEGVDPFSGTMWVTLLPKGKLTTPLATGAFGKTVITPSASTQAWSIPYDALLDGNGNEGFVFVTKDQKTAEKIQVKIISILNGRVLVGTGLEGISSIIVSGNAYLNQGSPIKIIQ